MHKIHFTEVDSTNTRAKQLAGKLEPGDSRVFLITADAQTAGRGRTGKSFDSRKGNGLYMTVLFPVGRPVEDGLFLTVAAAVAVCKVLRKYSRQEIRIKWVNDLYIEERKVCGILAEAVTDHTAGRMNYCALGVGINLDTRPENFPEELRGKAGSVNGIRISREQLAEEIAGEIILLSEKTLTGEEEREKVLEQYRDWSMILGREVFWEENGRRYAGVASEIDGAARLIVKTAGGRKCLDSGYVSIRF